ARGALDGDVAVVHVVDYGAVVAGDADAGLHGAADPDIPHVHIVEIARGLGAELQAVAAGFEITIPAIDVFAHDPAAERVIAFHAEGVIAATGEAAIVHLDSGAAHEVDGI